MIYDLIDKICSFNIINFFCRVKNTVWKSVTAAARENEIRKSDPGDIFNGQDYRSS